VDDTLNTILAALEGLDAPAVSDRVDALDALTGELPVLSQLTSQEWDVKLASVEDDVEELGEAADRAAARFEQARRALETLKRFAERHGAVIRDREGQPSLFGDDSRPGAAQGAGADRDGRHQNAVAQAETTRQAIIQVMARRPHREWTAMAIADDLIRYGRDVARSNVQVTLRRLAADSQVRKVGRGTYQLLSESLARPTGHDVATPPGEASMPPKLDRRQVALKAAATRRRNQEAAGG
jgi:hypothetical protein